MFSFANDDEDGFSLLSTMRQDGSIDLERALHLLDDADDEYHVDELSLLSCINAEGGLDVAKFLQQGERASLLELTMLKEAGLIDNARNPTDGATLATPLQPYKPHCARNNFFEIFDGEERRPATPKDSLWWKMYIEHPMLNVPKFHRVFRR